MTLLEKTRRAAELATAHYTLRHEMHDEMVATLRELPTAAQLELARIYVKGLRSYGALIDVLCDNFEAAINELVKDTH